MKVAFPKLWALWRDLYPLPVGCPVDPATWRGWMARATAEERRELLAAAVPIVAERWAEAMEDALDADPPLPLEQAAAETRWIVDRDLAGVGGQPWDIGFVVAFLAATWTHGAALAGWRHGGFKALYARPGGAASPRPAPGFTASPRVTRER